MEHREKFIKDMEGAKDIEGAKDTKEEVMETDIAQLSHELTYRRYLINNGRIRNFFQKMSMPEYLALHMLQESEQTDGIYSGKTYLKDIADKMQRPVRQISWMVKNLQERGLLVWSHDGDGSEGTYVTITESGRKLLEEEEEALKTYYGKVIANYGKENFIQLLQLMKQLEAIMGAEFEELGMEAVTIEDDGTDE